MDIKTTAPSADTTGLTQSLNQVLADSYALLSLTHLAHWNVEGQGFFALHAAFQTLARAMSRGWRTTRKARI